VFVGPWLEVGEGNVLAKALDDRAGCAILVDLIRSELPYDCWFSFTVQEETGCTGGVTAAYAVMPDIAIAVETTTASDIAGVPEGKTVCSFGGGPVLSFQDRGTVYDAGLYRFALNLAREKAIPAQSKTLVAGGNESRSLQIAGSGARVMAISMPCRYLHSPSCMLRVSDIAHTRELLLALCADLASGAAS
jgi:endoglucanase